MTRIGRGPAPVAGGAAVALLVAVVLVVAGCGGGPDRRGDPVGEARAAYREYVRALRADDERAVCAMLARVARERFAAGRSCEQRMRAAFALGELADERPYFLKASVRDGRVYVRVTIDGIDRSYPLTFVEEDGGWKVSGLPDRLATAGSRGAWPDSPAALISTRFSIFLDYLDFASASAACSTLSRAFVGRLGGEDGCLRHFEGVLADGWDGDRDREIVALDIRGDRAEATVRVGGGRGEHVVPFVRQGEGDWRIAGGTPWR